MKAKSLREYIDRKKLNEELHVDGLTFLGSAYSADLYEATTWDGAQALIADDDEQPAGTSWTRSEEIFNANINETTRLFFFVRPNTNRVVCGVISSNRLVATNCKNCDVQMNYSFQNLNGNHSIDLENGMDPEFILPLFLLPDLEYSGESGVFYSSGATEILTTYNGLINPENIPNVYEIPQGITTIDSGAFSGYNVPAVKIPTTVTHIEFSAFNGYTGTLEIAAEDENSAAVSGWDNGWDTNYQGEKIWNANVSPEDRERRRQEREAAKRAEEERIALERQAEEERARRELETRTAEAAAVLRYKEDKNGITILGGKRGRTDLEIPEMINNKPVIAIAPFAFYGNKFLRRVVVPKTVQTIGKAAFLGAEHATVSYPRKAQVMKDAFSGCNRVVGY